jgi:hypothetical protein
MALWASTFMIGGCLPHIFGEKLPCRTDSNCPEGEVCAGNERGGQAGLCIGRRFCVSDDDCTDLDVDGKGVCVEKGEHSESISEGICRIEVEDENGGNGGDDAGPAPDGGPDEDAGPAPDAGPADAGPPPDAGPSPDAGPDADAGNATDAGIADGGAPFLGDGGDAGSESDGGLGDGGLINVDGGMDSGFDAGPTYNSLGGTISGLVGSVELSTGAVVQLPVTADGGIFSDGGGVDGGGVDGGGVDGGGVDGGDIDGGEPGDSGSPQTAPGTEEKAFTSNGVFAFDVPIPSDTAYNVTVVSHPPGQFCSVQNGSGVMQDDDITNVMVICENVYDITVTAVSYDGTGLTVGDFSTGITGDVMGGEATVALPDGAAYDIRVVNQPASGVANLCEVENGTGVINGTTVTNAWVYCYRTFTVNSTTDNNDLFTDGVCEDNLGQCSFRAALEEANAGSLITRILLPSGDIQATAAGDVESHTNNDGDFDFHDIINSPSEVPDIIVEGQGPQAGANGSTLDGNNNVRVAWINADAHVVMRDLRIANGECGGSDGGGAALVDFNGELVLENVMVTGTTPTSAPGGVLKVQGDGIDAGKLTLRKSRVAYNNAGGDAHWGGAIFNGRAGQVWIEDSSLDHNQSQDQGGAIYNTGDMIIVNSTIAHNVTGTAGAEGGGAIYTGGVTQSSLTLLNTTVAFNDDQGSTQRTGGIFIATGTFTLENTLIAKNTIGGVTESDWACGGGEILVSQGGNLVGKRNNCTSFLIGSDQSGSTIEGTLDPLLLAPIITAEVGYTFDLEPGSPAIDAALLANCPSTDQLGNPRPVDGDVSGGAECDVGAMEKQ